MLGSNLGEYNIVGKRIGLKLSRGVEIEGVGIEGVGVGGEKERGNKKQEGSLAETFFIFFNHYYSFSESP